MTLQLAEAITQQAAQGCSSENVQALAILLLDLRKALATQDSINSLEGSEPPSSPGSAAENLPSEQDTRGTRTAAPPPEYTVVRTHEDCWKIKGPMFPGPLDEPIFLAEIDADTICSALNRLANAEKELAATRREYGSMAPLVDWLMKNVPDCAGRPIATVALETLKRLTAKAEPASLAHKYTVLAARGKRVEETES